MSCPGAPSPPGPAAASSSRPERAAPRSLLRRRQTSASSTWAQRRETVRDAAAGRAGGVLGPGKRPGFLPSCSLHSWCTRRAHTRVCAHTQASARMHTYQHMHTRKATLPHPPRRGQAEATRAKAQPGQTPRPARAQCHPVSSRSTCVPFASRVPQSTPMADGLTPAEWEARSVRPVTNTPSDQAPGKRQLRGTCAWPTVSSWRGERSGQSGQHSRGPARGLVSRVHLLGVTHELSGAPAPQPWRL